MRAARLPAAHHSVSTAREHAGAVGEQAVDRPCVAREHGATRLTRQLEETIGRIPYAHASVVRARPEAHPQHKHAAHAARVAGETPDELAIKRPHDQLPVGTAATHEASARARWGLGDAVDTTRVLVQLAHELAASLVEDQDRARLRATPHMARPDGSDRPDLLPPVRKDAIDELAALCAAHDNVAAALRGPELRADTDRAPNLGIHRHFWLIAARLLCLPAVPFERGGSLVGSCWWPCRQSTPLDASLGRVRVTIIDGGDGCRVRRQHDVDVGLVGFHFWDHLWRTIEVVVGLLDVLFVVVLFVVLGRDRRRNWRQVCRHCESHYSSRSGWRLRSRCGVPPPPAPLGPA